MMLLASEYLRELLRSPMNPGAIIRNVVTYAAVSQRRSNDAFVSVMDSRSILAFERKW